MKTYFYCLMIVTCLFLGTTAYAEINYTITDLGTLGGNGSWAYGINNSGQIVGYSLNNAGSRNAFLYENGQMFSLGSIGGETISYAVNNSGLVVGSDEIPVNNYRSFLYQNGNIANLHVTGGAYGINSSGQIVGEGGFFYNDGSVTYIGSLGGSYCEAFKINDSGQIVGYSTTDTGASHAFLYENSNMLDLGTLGGDYSRARAINNDGFVVGCSATATMHPIFLNHFVRHAFLYENSVMIDLGTLGGNYSSAEAINHNGVVVGNSEVISGVLDSHAFIFKNGGMVDLNVLLPKDSGWVLQGATGINDSGQIVGHGILNGNYRAFLMTPVPEPATLLLLGIGAIALRKSKTTLY